ncbi:hypothetical protein BN946_scf184836.g1 [Trametes cinnabarina]|uniref:Uncharacterized protein n=1 Tax=Pycnoporus cinnabarinus TaxID=5643 RepID=A0A060S625_PYCCI|nr:hypothetical protein BN946_scf184836.g1 [Trametes cinnabarina]
MMIPARQAIPAEVYGGFEMRVCDLPGSRKLEAFAAHNHKANPCYFCKITHDEINTQAAYDVDNFVLRDEWEQICHAFAYRDATTAKARKAIFEEHGQRWSQLFELPGWMPSGCAIDFMHNFYLGIAKEMYMAFLVRGHLLNKDMWRRLEELVNAIQWPSGIGRLPKNLGENHGFAKADQWRRWVNIQCTILWSLWGDDTDMIRRNAPQPPRNAKDVEDFDRSDLTEIYEVFLFASVAERILASKSISAEDVRRGHSYLRRCCHRMLALGIHLLPNHHLAMHYPEIFRLFGPVYAWWLYAHERFNGMQEKVRTNGKGDGEMELTLTRNWVAKQRLHELLVSLPHDATPEERELISRVVSNDRAAGTLRTHMLSHSAALSSIKAPPRIKNFSDLRYLPHPGVYKLLFAFVRTVWPDLPLADDLNVNPQYTTFSSTSSTRVFPFISVDGTRYGSIMDKRSSADRYACVDFGSARIPCRVLYHLERLVANQDIPVFPWSLYATDLGVYVAYAEQFHDAEVIVSEQLAAPVAIIPIKSRTLGDDVPLWAVHSFDRTGIEPEDDWFNELADELDSITN